MAKTVLPEGFALQGVAVSAPEGTATRALPVVPAGFELISPTQAQARETGPFRAAVIGAGKGLVGFARGVGLADPATPFEAEAFEALREEHPIATTGGEILGEAAPFLPLAVAGGALPTLAGRIAAGTAIGGAEGAIISKGAGEDVATGTGVGAVIGGVAEAVVPVLGRLGGALVRKVTGRSPKGAVVDAAGRPTQELVDALDVEGLTFEELSAQAQRATREAPGGAVPEQVARQARAEELGIPLTTGEVTQEFAQRRTEETLIGGADAGSEAFRQFKLKQSEAVNAALENLSGTQGVRKAEFLEDSGTLVIDALTGRRSLLRTQKNQLYEDVARLAKDKGGIPIFADNLAESLPSRNELRRMTRIKGSEATAVQDLLIEFGVVTDEDLVGPFVDRGGEVLTLTLENFEEFRAGLNGIIAADRTGVAGRIGGPIKGALDDELDEMFEVLKDVPEMPAELLDKLKQARAAHRQLKTEFTPKDLAGQLIALKPDNFTAVTEASKVYDKIARKSAPVESVRRMVNSLRAGGGEGQKGLEALRTTVILDLIDGGFSTKSRQISGLPVFNPVAFRNRLANIGEDKIAAIFQGDANTLGKLRNIDKVAQDLIAPERATPRGSADIVEPLMRRLIALSARNPLGAIVIEGIGKTAGQVRTAAAGRRAVAGRPETLQIRGAIEQSFPGLAAALGIAATVDNER